MAVELKHITIGVAIVITIVAIMLASIVEINKQYSIVDYDTSLETQKIKYENDINDISLNSMAQMSNSTQLTATSTSTTSGFDSLGALFKSAFSSATTTIDTMEQSQKVIGDIEEKAKPPKVLVALAISVLGLLILFGLIKLLTGRIVS